MARQGKGKGVRRDEAQWRALLSRFSDSGLSVSAFCRREAVSTASFYRWRGLIERHEGGEALAVQSYPAFVDLGALGAQSTAGAAVELSEMPAVFRLPTGRSHAAFGHWSCSLLSQS